MLIILNNIGIVISGLILIVLLLILIWLILAAIFHNIQDRKSNEQIELIKMHLGDLDRWCSYEFPIIEHITKYLFKIIDDRSCRDISNFRNDLRNLAKLGKLKNSNK